MQNDNVPVIDIGRLRSPDTLATLDEACRHWGFFQVTHHGIPARLITDVQRVTREFFAQPQAAKRAILRTRENPWGFYDRELTKNQLDLKEVFDVGPGDKDRLIPQWPPGMPAFRQLIGQYFHACETLAYRLLAGISLNLGMSAGFLSRSFGPGHSSFLRLNYYPVTGGGDSQAFGVGQHTDAGALTLLLQDDQAGLEVCHDGNWHPIPPRHDALVVNIGDIVQVWSNDRYHAALHRVSASRGCERYSVPFFFNPVYRADYAPLPSLIADGEHARYGTINWGEFRALRADGDYADYGEEIQIDRYRVVA
jgi:isopenicillin N synthase-like dioxygenase